VPAAPIRDAEYRALAEFRHQLRNFLRFSESAARDAGLEPQQHQFLLALRGLPAGAPATVGVLAERLQIKHHSAVGLVDRLEARSLVRRARGNGDRRQVLLALTPRGTRLLARLSVAHRAELRSVERRLAGALRVLLGRGAGRRASRARS
jgi:DNA-binding MarR family transcriptional regulator